MCVCVCLLCGCDLDSWSGSHIRWGQPFRLRHLTTGHYLALTEDRGLVLQDRERSNTVATAFCFRASKVRTMHILVHTRIEGHEMNALDALLFLKVTCITWAQRYTSSAPNGATYLPWFWKIITFPRTVEITGPVAATL